MKETRVNSFNLGVGTIDASAAKVDLVMPELSGQDSNTDTMYRNIIPDTLGRKIHYVRPLFTLHNTRIRGLVKTGKSSWRDYLPRGAYEVFQQIEGPERISKA